MDQHLCATLTGVRTLAGLQFCDWGRGGSILLSYGSRLGYRDRLDSNQRPPPLRTPLLAKLHDGSASDEGIRLLPHGARPNFKTDK